MRGRDLVLLLILAVAKATNIKWTGSQGGSNDPAKTAPKSQKYWDEHNIKRPDYAKTDAEVAAERGETNVASIWLGLLIIGGGLVAAYQQRTHSGGARLGSSTGVSMSTQSSNSSVDRGMSADERARQARLARFERRDIAEKND